jgi:hypothetical protein
MRNNRLTTNTTGKPLVKQDYSSIPFKNTAIDRLQRKSAEPMLFKDLPEVTVRANANQKLANNVSIGNADDRKKSSLKALRQIENNYVGGPRDLENKMVPKKKKKLLTADNALIAANAGAVVGVAGAIINGEIQNRKWKKQNPPRDWSNFDPWKQ